MFRNAFCPEKPCDLGNRPLRYQPQGGLCSALESAALHHRARNMSSALCSGLPAGRPLHYQPPGGHAQTARESVMKMRMPMLVLMLVLVLTLLLTHEYDLNTQLKVPIPMVLHGPRREV